MHFDILLNYHPSLPPPFLTFFTTSTTASKFCQLGIYIPPPPLSTLPPTHSHSHSQTHTYAHTHTHSSSLFIFIFAVERRLEQPKLKSIPELVLSVVGFSDNLAKEHPVNLAPSLSDYLPSFLKRTLFELCLPGMLYSLILARLLRIVIFLYISCTTVVILQRARKKNTTPISHFPIRW